MNTFFIILLSVIIYAFIGSILHCIYTKIETYSEEEETLIFFAFLFWPISLLMFMIYKIYKILIRILGFFILSFLGIYKISHKIVNKCSFLEKYNNKDKEDNKDDNKEIVLCDECRKRTEKGIYR